MIASVFRTCFGARVALSSTPWTLVLVCAVLGALGCTKSHNVNAVGLELADGGIDHGDAAAASDAAEPTPDSAAPSDDAATGDQDAAPMTACPADCDPVQANPLISIERCCTDEDGACGYEIAQLQPGLCLPEDAPGELDDSCPPVSFMGFISLPGCCRPDGTCGSMDSLLGLGCTLNAQDQEIPCGDGPQ
jgi:hypothetical protein